MKIITSVLLVGLACLIGGCSTSRVSSSPKEMPMIVHSVFFKLNHPAGSDAETAFLAQAAALAEIPGVGNFQVLEETSPKNNFDFGLSMEFTDQAAYDAYNGHPDHVRFVQEVWLKEVSEFQEIDYIPHTQR